MLNLKMDADLYKINSDESAITWSEVLFKVSSSSSS